MTRHKLTLPTTKSDVNMRIADTMKSTKEGLPRHMYKKRGNKIYTWYGALETKKEADAYAKNILTDVDTIVIKEHIYSYGIWIRV
jgi:hypothetical protein